MVQDLPFLNPEKAKLEDAQVVLGYPERITQVAANLSEELK